VNYGNDILGSQHLEVGALGNNQFVKMDQSVRSYHQTLQTKTDVEIDNLHALNMDSLDELTRKLKQSMTILDVTEEESPMLN